MNNEKNENKATSLQLTRDSGNELMKTYFKKVFELKQSGKEFPINFDEVWQIVYGRKEKALNSLKSDFIEGEDFYLHQMGKVVKTNELKNGVKVEVYLTVACMEYFIAKKVKPVFEVYRQVFHRVAESKPEPRQISKEATPLKEETLTTVKMGQYTNQIYVINGVIWARFAPICKYIGYNHNGSAYIYKLGMENCKQILVGKWFINVHAFDRLLNIANLTVPSGVMSAIYHDVFRVGRPLDDYVYHFTALHMLEIFELILERPINKDAVVDKLRKGKI